MDSQHAYFSIANLNGTRGAAQIMQQLTTEKQNKKYMAVRQEMIEKYGLEFK